MAVRISTTDVNFNGCSFFSLFYLVCVEIFFGGGELISLQPLVTAAKEIN